MHFDLKKPCANCPFRSDIFFCLTTDRVVEITDSILKENKTFACHKTTHGEYVETEDGGDLYQPNGGEQHCAGALIMIEKTRSANAMAQIAERLNFYDPQQLDLASPVFETQQDMVDVYRERNEK